MNSQFGIRLGRGGIPAVVLLSCVAICVVYSLAGCGTKPSEPEVFSGATVLVGDFDTLIINLREFDILSTRIQSGALRVRVRTYENCPDLFGALMTPAEFDSSSPPRAHIYIVNFGGGMDDCIGTKGGMSFDLSQVSSAYFRSHAEPDSAMLVIHGYRDKHLFELPYLPLEPIS